MAMKTSGFKTDEQYFPPEKTRSVNFAGYWQTSSTPFLSSKLAEHRGAFDEDPVRGFKVVLTEKLNESRKALSDLFKADYNGIGFCGSTTEGLFTAIAALRLRSKDHVIYADFDHYSLQTSTSNLGSIGGFRSTKLKMPRSARGLNTDAIVAKYIAAVKPSTRAILCTWVNSSNGLTFPLKDLADNVRALNQTRASSTQITLVVDGAHAIGQMEIDLSSFENCIFVFPFHKWFSGPRGTACIVTTEGCPPLGGSIPDFSNASIGRFMASSDFTGSPLQPSVGEILSAGGFGVHENFCAIPDAIDQFRHLQSGMLFDHLTALRRHLLHRLSGLEASGSVCGLWPLEELNQSSILALDCIGIDNSVCSNALCSMGYTVLTSPYKNPALRIAVSYWHTVEHIDNLVQQLEQTIIRLRK